MSPQHCSPSSHALIHMFMYKKLSHTVHVRICINVLSWHHCPLLIWSPLSKALELHKHIRDTTAHTFPAWIGLEDTASILRHETRTKAQRVLKIEKLLRSRPSEVVSVHAMRVYSTPVYARVVAQIRTEKSTQSRTYEQGTPHFAPALSEV